MVWLKLLSLLESCNMILFVALVLVQIMNRGYKGHRFLMESALKQLIQTTDE